MSNKEFFNLIESEEINTSEMMDRLITAQETISDIGTKVLELDEVIKEYKCPYNDLAFDLLKLSVNQLYTDIFLRIELIYAKDLSVFNRMTFSDKLSEDTHSKIQNDKAKHDEAYRLQDAQ